MTDFETDAWKSEQIDQLAAALAAAQREIKPAAKDSKNDHFKSRYADLASVWTACSEALTSHGLAVAQLPFPTEYGFRLRTVLLHTSGQWIASDLPMAPEMANAQKVGSALTYARRYGLAAITGVCPEDDDAEAAVSRPREQGQGQGQGRGGDGDRDRQTRRGEVNGSFQKPAGNGSGAAPARRESFSEWAGRQIQEARDDWQTEQAVELQVPRERRTELELEPNRLLNGLISAAAGAHKPDGSPRVVESAVLNAAGKRDRDLCRECAQWLWETQPKWTAAAVEAYIARKYDEARAALRQASQAADRGDSYEAPEK